MDGAFVVLTIPGRGERAYVASMSKGQIVTKGEAVTEVEHRYDLLRAEALSPSRSQQLLQDLLESA
ncbi:hypothetical protein B4N89_20215 [Embleya scabrispora]|uniref:DUF5753 domain-containing protein n=1 Tax=Embleya scabrispora TaxID=159449 RepID=A0A1T3P231_9ACTN|nr:hypothetical protein B4N89_20215 [Embleya scabrispora]